MSRPTMSLESALDEERREVLSKLDAGSKKAESPSRKENRNESPTVRSMLDVSSGPVPRHGSIAGIGVGVTDGARSPQSPPIRSMLDVTSTQASQPQQSARSAVTSSPSPTSPSAPDPRRGSAGVGTAETQGLPKVDSGDKKDAVQDHQFNMLPTISNQALPIRAAQGGRKPSNSTPSPAMTAAMTGDFSSLPGFNRAKEGRHNSTVGVGGKSSSPSSRLAPRTQSPGGGLLGAALPPNSYVTDKGTVVDMDKAYRKLSDKSAGSSSFSTNTSGDTGDADHRVQKDPIDVLGDEAAVESSEEDDDEPSSDEEEWKSEAERGRRRSRRKKGSTGSEEALEESDEIRLDMGNAPGPRQSKSQMAAAEEERKRVEARYPVQSLINEPEISITSPSGEKVPAKKGTVYPNTNFDHPTSAADSAESSDWEGDFSDIKRAQKMSINMSPLDASVPNRNIRTILRGDYAKMEEEASEGRRRQRMYIVAVDLSDESAHALEWTIGTMLRDGDTLLAIYAIDEELSNSKAGESEEKGGSKDMSHVAEGAKTAQDTVQSMEKLTERTKQQPIVAWNPSTLQPSGYVPATETKSLSGSVDARAVSRTELERLHAVEDISQTCIRLLRKTRLQVRVTVEVLHCKSPKHVINEAIDNLNPTLVVLGSRGRSALKGVLLGSFSNYLVTKSSTPVMVARKKLKKHVKVKGPNVRLANNLQTPESPKPRRKLSSAKVD